MSNFEITTIASHLARRCGLAIALLATSLVAVPSAWAMDAVVPTDFATIAEAIAGATDVDASGAVEILVMDGVYTEDLLIRRSDLVLMGTSAEFTTIQGSGIANTIKIDGASNVQIEGFTLLGSPTANVVALLNATGCSLSNSVVDGGNTGVSIRFSTGNTLADNEVRNNQNGIKVRSADGNTLSSNSVHNQLRNGIVLREGDDNMVDQNQVVDNGGHGVRVRDALRTIISGNTVTGSGSQGMRVRESSDTTIAGNISSSNTKNGLRMRDTTNSLVTMNTFTLNQEFGVRRRGWTSDDFDASLEGVQDPAGDNDLSGNVLGELTED